MHIGENNFKMKSQLILALLVSVALSANLNTDGYKDVDLSSIEVRTEFPAFNINDLTQSSTDSAVTNEFQFGIIRNAQKDNTIAVRSIDSLFSRLPSSLELDATETMTNAKNKTKIDGTTPKWRLTRPKLAKTTPK